MADVQFRYVANGPWQTYKQGYITNMSVTTDENFLQTSGFWYDANGTLFPPGSVAGVQLLGTIPPLGLSLGLSNF